MTDRAAEPDTPSSSDGEGDPSGETPIQKALRLKKAAIDAKPKPPRGGRFQREQAAAAHSSSKSKPWMSR
ncbi:MAG: hypothetical protein QE280_04700 [Caulobacter sp.]|jgi:hypothetical protein|nr:hypothetical protein [Caulobacter sp.]